jgi:hypothetical protein
MQGSTSREEAAELSSCFPQVSGIRFELNYSAHVKARELSVFRKLFVPWEESEEIESDGKQLVGLKSKKFQIN